MEKKRDLRKTLAQVQFWCQFGVGDRRSGAEWINWGGRAEDWVISRGTIVDGVEWRQEAARGLDSLLEAVELSTPEVGLEDMLLPVDFHDQILHSLSMFKRNKSTLTALDGLSQFFENMSVMDCTVDRQFTAYEIPLREKPSFDDILSEPVLRDHPGRRFELAQGTESHLSPIIRILTRSVLDERLKAGGYSVPPLSAERIVSQPVKDIIYRRE